MIEDFSGCVSLRLSRNWFISPRWGIKWFIASTYYPFNVYGISRDDLSFISDIAICVFFPFFLVYPFFIHLIDPFKETPFEFIDFL